MTSISFERMEASSPHRPRQLWNILGKKLPQSEVVYFTQVLLIYIVIITCIINLSRGEGDSNLWTCLLSSCLGYLLPNPKLDTLKKNSGNQARDESDVCDSAQQQFDEILPRQ